MTDTAAAVENFWRGLEAAHQRYRFVNPGPPDYANANKFPQFFYNTERPRKTSVADPGLASCGKPSRAWSAPVVWCSRFF